MTKPLLAIQNLSISVATTTLTHAVSLNLHAGKTLALVGESGSGKSLTALSILGLLPDSMTTTGQITYANTNLLTAKPALLQTIRGAKIGMIFQEPMTSLNPLHTIGQQLLESISLHQSLPPPALKSRVLELLTLVELDALKSRLNAYPHELSGGQRQRIMIAIAIANNPQILIADEPTTALDVTVQKHVLALLKKLQKDLNMALLLISHDLSIVNYMADEIAVMKDGKIVETAATKTLFTTPKHAYTKKLLNSAPKGSPVPLPSLHSPSSLHSPLAGESKSEAPPTFGGARDSVGGSEGSLPKDQRPTTNDSLPTLQTNSLTVTYPLSSGFLGFGKRSMTAVQNAAICIKRGQTIGIVGESGSGKTTLAMAILRLAPSTGTIIFQQNRIDHLSQKQLRPLRKNMQVVFQDPFGSLNPRLTIAQIIGEGLLAHKEVMRVENRESSNLVNSQRPTSNDSLNASLITQALTDVGLDPSMSSRYPHEFSGGQRQRIAIARALILNPSLIILDEPTSALDVSTQSSILKLLKNLQKTRKISYLFISHDLRVIRTIAHHILVMKDGQIIESQDNTALFETPKHPYTKTLLEAALI